MNLNETFLCQLLRPLFLILAKGDAEFGFSFV